MHSNEDLLIFATEPSDPVPLSVSASCKKKFLCMGWLLSEQIILVISDVI